MIENDLIAKQVIAELDAGLKFRLDREKQWKLNEDFYFNRVKKNIKGKFNIPVPIVPGFVDTWISQMKAPIDLEFGASESADYRAAKKTQGLYMRIKTKEDLDWDDLDADGKKMACLYGKADYYYQAKSRPEYTSTLILVDPYDMIDDPMGGSDTEQFKFRIQDNIFRSKEDLKDGVATGIYDGKQIFKLINATSADRLISNDTIYQSKQNRFVSLSLNSISYNYAGQDLYKFAAAGTIWKGERYYVVLNRETGIWIRCEPLEKVFKSDLWPWTGWRANREPFISLPKAPVEDIIPVAEVIRVLVNQEVDNRNKRNYGQRAYDPDMFPNPAELEWRQDGLVSVKVGESRIRPIASGIYQFETPEMQGTINLVNWMDNLLKEKTGVNSVAEGSAQGNKVGIAFLNLQQAAERVKAANVARQKCWKAIGRRFVWGLSEHMRSPMAVKIIGEQGFEWDKLARYEINPEWDIVIAGIGDAGSDEIKKKALRETLSTLTPIELSVLNPKKVVKVKLDAAGVDEEQIMILFDMKDESSKEILSMASQMIQDTLAGKPTRIFRGATTDFLQKILNFALDEDLSDNDYFKLMNLIEQHKQIVAENMARKAMMVGAAMGIPPGATSGNPTSSIPPLAPGVPVMPGVPAGNPPPVSVQQQTQDMTAMAPHTNAA